MKIYYRYIALAIVAMITFVNASGVPASDADKFTVILDPGHGGKDYGAIGRLTNEKTINLDVAKRVRQLLKHHDDVKTVMTRSNDVFLSLQERADIANREHGNLFISIHVNSVARKARNRNTIAGASVYTLGLHRTAENLDVAMRENAVMSLEPDHTARYMGFDPTSTESYIIFELNQNMHLDQSINFAQMVQDQLTTTASRQDRGVRQAGFWVLMATAMPAVLVELDFICNPTTEKFLHSDTGKDKLAKAIYRAICEYRGINSGQELEPDTLPITEPLKQESVIETAAQQPMTSATSTDDVPLTYRIQILASDSQLPKKSAQLKGVSDITFYKEKGVYKYTTGSYDSMQEAQSALRRLRGKFPQAFIIKWRGDHREY